MLYIKPGSNKFLFAFSWISAIVLGWILIAYPGLTLRDEIISSWNALPNLMWKLFTGALTLGLVIGIFQYCFLYFTAKVSGWWILLSTASYAIANPLAFILSVSLIASIAPETMTSGGLSFISMPLAFIMLFAGLFVGAIQLTAFIGHLSLRNWRKVLLWIFGSSLAWILAFLVITYSSAPNTPLFIPSGLAGLVIGVFTAILVLMMLKD